MNAKTTEDQLVYNFEESTTGVEYVHDTSINSSIEGKHSYSNELLVLDLHWKKQTNGL